ncbi:hypothetical protein V8G54_020834 [Vigna mungo]|uniref:diphosphoinositol-pentakisphosphate 1-kinase n=1 Tax=Vigna mungo TaxID=3915 RepID=A0AAQ3RW98_VIGMU
MAEEMDEEVVLAAKKITIGVCVMEKKVKCGYEVFSAPMEQILQRLQAFGEFEVVYFGDKVILEEPIESWPVCDCLIAFHSSGYPLEKAEAYSALRKRNREDSSLVGGLRTEDGGHNVNDIMEI